MLIQAQPRQALTLVWSPTLKEKLFAAFSGLPWNVAVQKE